MALLYGHDEAVQDFVRAVYGRPDIEFPGARAIGVLDGGELVAGIVAHDWHPEAGTIELSIAATSRRWLTRAVINALARYVFAGCKAQLLVMRTSEHNRPACRIAEALGFHGHVVPRLRGRDEAEIIYTMPAEDWQAGRFARST